MVNTSSSLFSCLRSQSAEGSDHLPEDLQLAAGLQSAGPRMSLPVSLPYLCTRRGRPKPSSGGRDSSPVAGTVAHRCISVIFEWKFYLNTTWMQFGQERKSGGLDQALYPKADCAWHGAAVPPNPRGLRPALGSEWRSLELSSAQPAHTYMAGLAQTACLLVPLRPASS